MDYGYIIKRAWKITWEHKILWLFGFFLMSGGANYSSSFQTPGTPGDMAPEQMEAMTYAFEQVEPWLPVLIGVAILMAVVAIVWWVFSIAANGGLVHLANEAEEGREVRAGLGWRAGFRNWGRVFIIYLILFIPIIIMGLIAFAVVIASAAAAGGGPEALTALLASMCCVIIAAIFVGLIAAFFITILGQLGVRHAVLADMGPIDALKEAWNDLRTRFKDVFLMWLITIGIGIAYGMVVGVVAMFFGFATVALMFTGAVWVAFGLGLLMFLLLLIPNAVYSTYVSALWTVFYRRLTGRDKAPEAPAYRVPPSGQPAYPGAPPAPPAPGGYPPPPPTPGGYPAPPPSPGSTPPAPGQTPESPPPGGVPPGGEPAPPSGG
jgi:hypothetical protein